VGVQEPAERGNGRSKALVFVRFCMPIFVVMFLSDVSQEGWPVQ
jgi:hypothetical protein